MRREMKIFIVDGYNVIYSLDYFRGIKDMEKARSELIELVRKRFGSNYKIVFDGKIGNKYLNNPSVIFTSEIQEADEVILSIVSKYLKGGHKVFVVTKDRELIEKCKKLGAEPLDPSEIVRKARLTSDKNLSPAEKQSITRQMMKELGIENGGENERI